MKFKGLISTPRKGWLLPLFAVILALVACGRNSQSAPPLSKKGKAYRLEWNLKTLVEPYEKAGHKSSAWDAAAKRALTEFARSRSLVTETNEDAASIISTSVIAATQAGCDDPMVHYLFIRYGMDQTNSREAFVTEFCQTAKDLDNSRYPVIRKFYAAARAMDQLLYTYGTNAAKQADYPDIEGFIGKNLQSTLDDATMPAEEAYEVAEVAINFDQSDATGLSQAYNFVEKPMFAHWPDAATTWLMKGQAHFRMGWLARGTGDGSQVSEQAFKTFSDELTISAEAFSNAWRLDPTDGRVPTAMIGVDEGLQKKRDEMEVWFGRAMACDPNNYPACSYKLHYLYPQWYGSREDMLAFGRECVASTKWGGTVPLILVDAHDEYQRFLPSDTDRADYWKQPDVWPDVKAAYDRFFELHPTETGKYNNYAWYAYRCEQWDAFLALLPKIDAVDYNYFGGQDKYDSMVQHAKHESATK
jgi:hypothetical protein